MNKILPEATAGWKKFFCASIKHNWALSNHLWCIFCDWGRKKFLKNLHLPNFYTWEFLLTEAFIHCELWPLPLSKGLDWGCFFFFFRYMALQFYSLCCLGIILSQQNGCDNCLPNPHLVWYTETVFIQA